MAEELLKNKEAECPIFPSIPKRIHWDLENPGDFTGTEEEKLRKVKELKDKVKILVLGFINEYGN